MDSADWNRKLMTACKVDRLADAREAISQGADVNVENTRGETPLCCALWNSGAGIMDLLLDHGARPDRNRAEDYPSEAQLKRRVKGNPELARAVGRLGYAFGPADVAMDFFDHVAAGHVEHVEDALAENRELIGGRNSEGLAPLHVAARNAQTEIAKLLLEAGSDVDVESKDYRATPLNEACMDLNVEMTRLLLKHGADVNHACEMERLGTPIHAAIALRSDELFELLAEHGADLNAPHKWCETPLNYAIEEDADRFVRLLIQRGADVNPSAPEITPPLVTAATFGNLAAVKLLLEHGADIQAGRAEGHTALDAARDSGHRDVAAYLESVGAS